MEIVFVCFIDLSSFVKPPAIALSLSAAVKLALAKMRKYAFHANKIRVSICNVFAEELFFSR